MSSSLAAALVADLAVVALVGAGALGGDLDPPAGNCIKIGLPGKSILRDYSAYRL